MKQRAEVALKDLADNYRKLLTERLARELEMIDESRASGNFVAANHHQTLAQVYKSILD